MRYVIQYWVIGLPDGTDVKDSEGFAMLFDGYNEAKRYADANGITGYSVYMIDNG